MAAQLLFILLVVLNCNYKRDNHNDDRKHFKISHMIHLPSLVKERCSRGAMSFLREHGAPVCIIACHTKPVNSFTLPDLTAPIRGIIMLSNGEEGKSRRDQTPTREPGQLKTGGG